MAKVSNKELREAVDAHRQAITNFKGCVGDNEKARGVDWMKRTGSDLMAVLERDFRATVDPRLVRTAQNMVDESANHIGRVEFPV